MSAANTAALIADANRALFVDVDVDAIARFFAVDYVVHAGVDGVGHAFVERAVATLHKAFPQLRVDVVVLVESGDRIAWQRTLSGAQQGPFAGFPATGSVVTWREQVTSMVRDGKIAEEWLVSDLAEQLLRSRKRRTVARPRRS
jgi:predicted ester cyclase